MRNACRPAGRFFCLLMVMAAATLVALRVQAQASGPAMTQVVAPNTGAQPAGVYYKVVYQLAGQEPSTEYWVVPATGSTSIGSVRAKLMPPTIAAQMLTRDVADTNYVHVAGDQTLNGAVTFTKSPSVPTPQNPGDAANKGYVDAVASGSGNLASPAPIGSVTPNSGTFTTVRELSSRRHGGGGLGLQGRNRLRRVRSSCRVSKLAAPSTWGRMWISSGASPLTCRGWRTRRRIRCFWDNA